MEPVPAPASDTPETLAELAAEHARHTAEAERHKAEADRIAEKIRAELGSPGAPVRAGNFDIKWSPPKRTFSAPAFMAAYPPDKNRHMYKLVPDGDAIPPKLKAQYMHEGRGEGTVTVK